MVNYIHFLSSFWMCAIIWFVQVVHYPLFLTVPKFNRIEFSQKHQFYISFLVMPAMVIEVVTLGYCGQLYGYSTLWLGLTILLILIWLSTFLLQVPCHQQLLHNPTDSVCHRLVQTNWIRTWLWSFKTIGSGWFLWLYI